MLSDVTVFYCFGWEGQERVDTSSAQYKGAKWFPRACMWTKLLHKWAMLPSAYVCTCSGVFQLWNCG